MERLAGMGGVRLRGSRVSCRSVGRTQSPPRNRDRAETARAPHVDAPAPQASSASARSISATPASCVSMVWLPK